MLSDRQRQAIRRSIRVGRPRGIRTRVVQAKAAEIVALVVDVVKQKRVTMAWREPL